MNANQFLNSFVGMSIVITLLTGCSAIPKRGIVFSDSYLDDCGLFDLSIEHDGTFLRATETLPRSLTQSGSLTHNHLIPHDHSLLVSSNLRFKPLGLDEEGAAANHTHQVETTALSAANVNDASSSFDHIRVGLYQRRSSSRCVPQETIIGFVGEAIPENWELVNDEKIAYLLVADRDRTLKTQLGSAHQHEIKHGHEATISESQKQLQLFRDTPNHQSISSKSHRHTSVAFESITVTASPTEPELPRLAMRLLRSTKEVKRLPRGAVIGYAGDRLPGLFLTFPRFWKTALPVDGTQIEGLFLSSESNTTKPLVFEATTEHNHKYQHSHNVLSTEASESAGSARHGINEWLSSLEHVHKERINDTNQTSSADHVPKHTNLLLLIAE